MMKTRVGPAACDPPAAANQALWTFCPMQPRVNALAATLFRVATLRCVRSNRMQLN
jgi:hypothetical protein